MVRKLHSGGHPEGGSAVQAIDSVPEPSRQPPPLVLGAQFPVRALHVFERIDTRALNRMAMQTGGLIAATPTTLRLSAEACAVCLRYGVVVLIGRTTAHECSELYARIESAGNVRHAGNEESEELLARVDAQRGDRMVGEELAIADTSVERLQVVAEALARSVILASYEGVLAEAGQKVDPLVAELGARGKSRQSSEDLLKTIGLALQIRQALVNRAEVGDKPEQLWERPELEKLFAQLMDELEIRERNAAIEAKLALIAEIANTALDLIRYSRTLRVEWYIALLIIVDIALTIFKSV